MRRTHYVVTGLAGGIAITGFVIWRLRISLNLSLISSALTLIGAVLGIATKTDIEKHGQRRLTTRGRYFW